MLPIFNNGSDSEMTSATSMDISESFRPEDLSKTDFFDFVSAPPEQESNQGAQSVNNSNNNEQQPLQGFDQVSVCAEHSTPLIMLRDKFLLIKRMGATSFMNGSIEIVFLFIFYDNAASENFWGSFRCDIINVFKFISRKKRNLVQFSRTINILKFA